MPKLLLILKPFKFAHEGIRVEEFEPGDEPVELTDECAAVALEERWAVEPAPPAPVEPPAPPAAKRASRAAAEAPAADLIAAATDTPAAE